MRRIRIIAAAFLLVTVCTSDGAFAQRRSTESEANLLRRDDVRGQLGLSADQIAKLEALQAGSNPGREVMDPFLERMRNTDDEAERTKIREELNAAVAKARTGFETGAIDVLSEAQQKALRTMFIREAGVRAMLDPRVQSDLGLTDEQKESLNTLGEERRVAVQGLGFGASPEQRAAFDQEWEAKFVAVLTGPQQTVWKGQTALAAAAEAAVPMAAVPGAAPQAPETGAAGAGQTPPAGAPVVSSFGTTVDDNAEAKIVDSFSFNFQYAPWEPILADYASAAGYTLDMTETPPGTLTHIDKNTYTADQVLNILNGYLMRRGFILVRKDSFLVCLNTDRGVDPVLVPDVTLDNLDTVGDNELVRVPILVEGVDVGVMAQEVETLVGRIGTMTAFTQTGMLVITDIGANIRRINQFITDSSRPRDTDQVFTAYPLRSISVDEALPLLLTQFGMRSGTANVSAAAEDRGRGSQSSRSSSPTTAQGLQVGSDPRTNSLFVTGNKKQHALVSEILKAIDVSEGPDGRPLVPFGNTGPYLRVYQVSGDAREVAKSIEAMMPGVVVNEDGRGGRVHIFATARQHEQVDEWVRAFGSGGGSGSVAVISLNRMDPLSAAALLRNLFLSEGDDAPTIETDLYGRRIIVKGEAGQIEQIKTVLAEMGEDGSPIRRSDAGPIRRYSIPGRSPEEFLNFLRESWEASEPNPIRIVVPREQGPIRELRTPQGPVNSDGSSVSEDAEGESQTRRDRRAPPGDSGRWLTTSAQETPEATQPPADVASGHSGEVPQGEPRGRFNLPADAATGRPEAEILIYVQGDELILRSEDEEALTRLEEMMDALQQSLPYRTTWTVFYLQTADATEAAALLEQFFPNSSVSSTADTGFSMASMFRPVTDAVSDLSGLSGLGMSPQTLRIIPDVRSNSLFITGPESVVRDVGQMLQVLDSDEIPESMRDMQPRTIEVQHADIDEVATIVRDIFKPYIEPQGGRGQQGNPLAALMGGGGGGRNDQSQQVRMTVSVDRQTSSLIVSSSQALFDQVQGLVSDLESQSLAASPGIRIVQLRNADVASVQQSLSNLSPRVTTSSTRPAASSGTPGAGGGGDNNAAAAQQDAFRRAMEDRMRSGGGSPFGGGASPFGGGSTGGRPSFGGSTGGRPSFGGSTFGGRTFGGRGGR